MYYTLLQLEHMRKNFEGPFKEAFRETWLCDIAQKMEGTELTVDEALEAMAKTGNLYIIYIHVFLSLKRSM